MNSNKLAGLDDNRPGRCVAYREYSGLRFYTGGLDVIFEAVGYLLRDESNFNFSSTFGIRQDQFAALTVLWTEIQYLTNSQSTACHQFTIGHWQHYQGKTEPFKINILDAGCEGKLMGVSVRVFIIEENDTVHKITYAMYKRIVAQEPDARLKQYAGRRVRYSEQG
jgi:hypothetical protein